MKIRMPLIALGLALAATSAFAATPQPAAAGKAVKHQRTCEQRSKIGKCEKWSDAKQDKQDSTAAAKKS